MKEFDRLKKTVLRWIDQEIQKDEQEVKKAICTEERLEKAGFPVGTTREWKGAKYKKIAPNKWRKVYEGESRGSKQALQVMKKKVISCKTPQQIYEVLKEYKERIPAEMFKAAKTLAIAEVKDAKKKATPKSGFREWEENLPSIETKRNSLKKDKASSRWQINNDETVINQDNSTTGNLNQNIHEKNVSVNRVAEYLTLAKELHPNRTDEYLEKYIAEIRTRIKNKDEKLIFLLRTKENKLSRKVFEGETGISLGTTANSAIAAFDKEFLGEDIMNRIKGEEEKKEAERKESEKEAERQKKEKLSQEYHGYFSGKTSLAAGKIKTHLEKKYRFSSENLSGLYSIAQAIDILHEKGTLKPDMYKINTWDRRKYNRMDGRQQAEYEKIDHTKTEYRVNNMDMGKMGYDYAKYLSDQGDKK